MPTIVQDFGPEIPPSVKRDASGHILFQTVASKTISPTDASRTWSTTTVTVTKSLQATKAIIDFSGSLTSGLTGTFLRNGTTIGKFSYWPPDPEVTPITSFLAETRHTGNFTGTNTWTFRYSYFDGTGTQNISFKVMGESHD